MAVNRVAFRAHQGDAVLTDAFSYPMEAFLKDGEFGDGTVIGTAFHIASLFDPPGAKFLS
jgi:hypothetical protein